MSAELGWSGLSELSRVLADLPQEVRETFRPVLTEAGEQIVAEATSAYAADGVPSLAEGMRVEQSREAGDLAVRVRVTSPVAHLREFGTVDRYAANGAFRGRQPARPVFIPIVERVRAQVADQLEKGLRELPAAQVNVR